MSQGAIMLLCWAIALVVLVVFLVLGIRDWKANLPKETLRGIGIRYLPGTVQPWPGLPELIDAMVDQVTIAYPKDAQSIIGKTWLEVVPYAGLTTSQFLPTGFVGTKRATGTTRLEKCFGIGPAHFTLVVRQLRTGDTSAQNDAANGTGPLRSAGSSAATHEFAQHLCPYLETGNWNFDHSLKPFIAFELLMDKQYAAKWTADQKDAAACACAHT